MPPAAFKEAITVPNVRLLDVRTAEEFAAGHLPDAANLDFHSPDFAAVLDGLDKGVTYAIYCRTGNRSGQAAEVMRSLGFKDVVNMDGGITAWQGAGYPVVTE